MFPLLANLGECTHSSWQIWVLHWLVIHQHLTRIDQNKQTYGGRKPLVNLGATWLTPPTFLDANHGKHWPPRSSILIHVKSITDQQEWEHFALTFAFFEVKQTLLDKEMNDSHLINCNGQNSVWKTTSQLAGLVIHQAYKTKKDSIADLEKRVNLNFVRARP